MLRGSLVLIVLVSGCGGPLTVPMVQRLDEETQAEVDSAWSNMMKPHDRLDHTLLLDVLIAHQFHHKGVDRLHLVSEKRVNDGLALMEIRYDREQPTFDVFMVTYLDGEGKEQRRETYSRDEINARVAYLYSPCLEECEGECQFEKGDVEDLTEECREALEVREQRLETIAAATQPA